MPVYTCSVIGFDPVSENNENETSCIQVYVSLIRTASIEEAHIELLRQAQEMYPHTVFNKPLAVEIAPEFMLEALADTGIKVYNQQSIKNLIEEALTWGDPREDRLYHRQFERIANELGITLGADDNG